MNDQTTDTIAKIAPDTLPKTVTTDTLVHRISNPIDVEMIDNLETADWNIWFWLIVVLTLIAIILPFFKKRKNRR